MNEVTNVQTVETEVRQYTLRKLGGKDIFLMSQILNKIGLRELKNCLNPEQLKAIMNESGNVNVEALGMNVAIEIASILFENLPKCEKDLYAFLSGMSGMDESQIENFGIAEFAQMIVDVIQKDEFKDFIKVVSKLFK